MLAYFSLVIGVFYLFGGLILSFIINLFKDIFRETIGRVIGCFSILFSSKNIPLHTKLRGMLNYIGSDVSI